jgi:hypothetical protein
MSDTITILRVEDANGKGPFTARVMNIMHGAMGDRDHDWHASFPTATETIGVHPGMVCGTETARDLVAWFPAPIRDVLADLGFGVTVYELPAADMRRANGAMQVVFDRTRARRHHRPFPDRFARRLHRKAIEAIRLAA